MSPARARAELYAVLALALVVRVGAVLVDSGYEPRNDAFDYHRHGVSIAAGDGYPESIYGSLGGPSALRPPAYPVLLGAVYAVSGDSVTAGRLAGALLGAVTVGLIFSIAAAVWGPRAALAAAALGAVYPPLVLLSTELFTENLYIPLMLLALLLALRFRERPEQLRWAAAAGVAAGLALLTRNAALPLLVPLVIGLWGRPWLRAGSLAAPALALVCVALAIAPWTVRNAVEFGRFLPIASSSGVTLAGTYNSEARADERFPAGWRNPSIVGDFAALFATPALDEATFDRQLRIESLDFVGEHPGYLVTVLAHNLPRMFGLEGGAVVAGGVETTAPGIGNRSSPVETASLALAVLLAGLGVAAILLARSRSRPGSQPAWPQAGPLFLWLVPLLIIIGSAPLGGLPRYRLPADPFLLIAAGIGIVWLLDRLGPLLRSRAGSARRAVASGAFAAVLIAAAGCGGGGGGSAETDPPAGAPETTAGGPGAVPSKEEYIRRADAICRRAAAETRRLREQVLTQPLPESGNSYAAFTKLILPPGIAVHEREARRLRALPRPEEDGEVLNAYLGQFDVVGALLQERLRVGLQGDSAESQALEQAILGVAEEQLQSARSFGFSDCAVRLDRVLLPSSG